MVRSEEGYVTEPNQLRDRIQRHYTLNKNYRSADAPLVYPNNRSDFNPSIEYDVEEFPELKDSTEANSEDVLKIMRAIRDNYSSYDGFVVIHGTDTMSYVGSAISFMIRNLTKPIVFTGSMVPMSAERSDASTNLARTFGWLRQNQGVSGVYLIFHKQRMLIKDAYKFDTYKRNAFRSISPNPSFKGHAGLRSKDDDVVFLEKIEEDIEIIKMSPFGTHNGRLLRNALKCSRGVVIESYGDGNIPACCVEIIKDYPKVPVLIVTQCRQGNMKGAYACGRALQSCENVIIGNNMTVESAVSRLAVFVADAERGDIDALRELFAFCESSSENGSGNCSSEGE